ncbi:MAG: hypothetical protein K6F26_03330 [Lachnospiraceae bacterium]|nr:hypothetical protein [Lachnospiraceae bacterium]
MKKNFSKEKNIQYRTYADQILGEPDYSEIEGDESFAKTEIWEKHPLLKYAIALGLALLDFLVVAQIFDNAIVQKQWLSFILSLGVAVCLNFIPFYTAKFLIRAKYRLDKKAKVELFGSIILYFMLYIPLLILRFAYYDMYIGSGSAGLISGLQTQTDVSGEVFKAKALVFVFSISPLVTSGICLLMGYCSSNPLEEKLKEAKCKRKEIIAKIHWLQYARKALERDTTELLEADEGRYEAARNQIHEKCNVMRARARFLLAQYLGRPDATSIVSADALEAVSEPRKTSEKNELPLFSFEKRA